jgi:hypothetical protein
LTAAHYTGRDPGDVLDFFLYYENMGRMQLDRQFRSLFRLKRGRLYNEFMPPQRTSAQHQHKHQRKQRLAHENHSPSLSIFFIFALRTNKSHEAPPLLRTIAFMAIKSLQEIF